MSWFLICVSYSPFKIVDVDWKVVKMTDKGTLRCPKELDSEGNWIAKQPRKSPVKYEFCQRKNSGSITRLMNLYKDFEKVQNNIKG